MTNPNFANARTLYAMAEPTNNRNFGGNKFHLSVLIPSQIMVVNLNFIFGLLLSLLGFFFFVRTFRFPYKDLKKINPGDAEKMIIRPSEGYVGGKSDILLFRKLFNTPNGKKLHERFVLPFIRIVNIIVIIAGFFLVIRSQ